MKYDANDLGQLFDDFLKFLEPELAAETEEATGESEYHIDSYYPARGGSGIRNTIIRFRSFICPYCGSCVDVIDTPQKYLGVYLQCTKESCQAHSPIYPEDGQPDASWIRKEPA